jgi:hypothetical protein
MKGPVGSVRLELFHLCGIASSDVCLLISLCAHRLSLHKWLSREGEVQCFPHKRLDWYRQVRSVKWGQKVRHVTGGVKFGSAVCGHKHRQRVWHERREVKELVARASEGMLQHYNKARKDQTMRGRNLSPTANVQKMERSDRSFKEAVQSGLIRSDAPRRDISPTFCSPVAMTGIPPCLLVL